MRCAPTIRLLTSGTNEKGDLFNKLMLSLFEAMGFEKLQANVAKAGREIDIQGRHRLEPRLLRAECKAHAKKMGGTELNTFSGALGRERRKSKEPVVGYFVSLGGFTDTAIEQEEDYGEDGLILLAGPKIIAELELHRLIVDDAQATEQAGQCAARAGLTAQMLASIELLGYKNGLVKAVYYAEHGETTHFALIDANGTPLADKPAREVIAADRASGGTLRKLTYLVPLMSDTRTARTSALAHYRRWLSEECGFIQLDGLPASLDDSVRKPDLGRLFIPLKALPLLVQQKEEGGLIQRAARHVLAGKEKVEPIPIGHLLAAQARLALLAVPGAGKSTLLKRIALEYGFEKKNHGFTDQLPAHKWLPLYLRCRDLQDRAKQSFMSLLEELPVYHLNMLPEPAVAFKAYIHEMLQLGRVLLLIDGLDEISDEGARKTFTRNLLSFLAMFPQVTLVLTSREAGFRLVADVMATKCTAYTLAPFEQEDVRRLCVQWHAEVVGKGEEVRQKALKLAEDIWANERIRSLAENPLLLTTLLVVNRRRGGELPKNRTMLYSKAVEVLVQTWNQEGHEPLDEEETLAQLSYVACYMMEQGTQQITRRDLIKLLTQAQQTIPELRFTHISPASFIKRVEQRSSLLMQVGRKFVEETQDEQELYEFRHLTFQEYLAARGYVEGHHSRGQQPVSLVTLLSPHFQDARWQEVVPLAVVLAKRQAEETIIQLTAVCENTKLRSQGSKAPLHMLSQCLLDEALISASQTLENALRQAARNLEHRYQQDANVLLVGGKFGIIYQEVVEQEFISERGLWQEYVTAFVDINAARIKAASNRDATLLLATMFDLLRSADILSRLRGLAALENVTFNMGIAWEGTYSHTPPLMQEAEPVEFSAAEEIELYNILSQCLTTGDYTTVLLVCRTLSWFPYATHRKVYAPAEIFIALLDVIEKLPNIERDDEHMLDIIFYIAFAFTAQYVLPRNTLIGKKIEERYLNVLPQQLKAEVEVLAAWHGLIPLTDKELIAKIEAAFPVRLQAGEDFNVSTMLNGLGKSGKALLAKRDKLREELQKSAQLTAHSESDSDLPF